jgi:hypothetical protein
MFSKLAFTLGFADIPDCVPETSPKREGILLVQQLAESFCDRFSLVAFFVDVDWQEFNAANRTSNETVFLKKSGMLNVISLGILDYSSAIFEY